LIELQTVHLIQNAFWEHKMKLFLGLAWWLTPVILATWEVEIRGWRFEATPGKIRETLSQKTSWV
jgi:hypothetical protein